MALRLRFQHGMTAEEAFWAQNLLGALGSLGYERVSMAHLDLSSTLPHYSFRNEWWRLRGCMVDPQGVRYHVCLTIWRHSTLPPDLWTREPRDYSLVKVLGSFTREKQTIHSSSPAWQEGVDFHIRGTQNLEMQHQSNRLRSDESGSIFPLHLDWDIAGTRLRLALDSPGTPFMLHSNGCAPCADGIGAKQYILPKVEGQGTAGHATVQFRGFWDHRWEFGVAPRGFSSSTYLRSLTLIEDSLRKVPQEHEAPSYGDTLELLLSIRATVVYLRITGTTISARIIGEDGMVDKRQVVTIRERARTSQGFVVVLVVECERFSLHLRPVASSFLSPLAPGLQYMDAPVRASGYLDGEVIEGWGFLQMPPQSTHIENRDFLQTALALEAVGEESDPIAHQAQSWMLWAVPVLLGTLLVLAIGFIVFHKHSPRTVRDQAFQKNMVSSIPPEHCDRR